MTTHTPDRHALNIAQAVQQEAGPDMVILFGSRATGKHHEHSDIDILVVTRTGNPQSAKLNAYHAAHDYMNTNPPRLEVSVIGMAGKDFDYCRNAGQHIAGQAARYGVIMNGENLDCRANYETGYPVHWVETQRRIQNAEEYIRQFNEMVDENHWNQTMLGFMAQQSVENALKGWLSAYNDDRTFGHDLSGLWRDIANIETGLTRNWTASASP